VAPVNASLIPPRGNSREIPPNSRWVDSPDPPTAGLAPGLSADRSVREEPGVKVFAGLPPPAKVTRTDPGPGDACAAPGPADLGQAAPPPRLREEAQRNGASSPQERVLRQTLGVNPELKLGGHNR